MVITVLAMTVSIGNDNTSIGNDSHSNAIMVMTVLLW